MFMKVFFFVWMFSHLMLSDSFRIPVHSLVSRKISGSRQLKIVHYTIKSTKNGEDIISPFDTSNPEKAEVSESPILF
jgi:hypothetical protein